VLGGDEPSTRPAPCPLPPLSWPCQLPRSKVQGVPKPSPTFLLRTSVTAESAARPPSLRPWGSRKSRNAMGPGIHKWETAPSPSSTSTRSSGGGKKKRKRQRDPQWSSLKPKICESPPRRDPTFSRPGLDAAEDNRLLVPHQRPPDTPRGPARHLFLITHIPRRGFPAPLTSSKSRLPFTSGSTVGGPYRGNRGWPLTRDKPGIQGYGDPTRRLEP